MLYHGMVRYEGVAGIFTLDEGEVIVLAPHFAALKTYAVRFALPIDVDRSKCKVAKMVAAPEITIAEPEPAIAEVGRDGGEVDPYPDSPEGHDG